MDETVYNPGPSMMGISFTAVTFQGKLFVETLEGTLLVKAEAARLEVLKSGRGNRLVPMKVKRTREGVRFKLTGEFAGANYILHIDKKTAD